MQVARQPGADTASAAIRTATVSRSTTTPAARATTTTADGRPRRGGRTVPGRRPRAEGVSVLGGPRTDSGAVGRDAVGCVLPDQRHRATGRGRTARSRRRWRTAMSATRRRSTTGPSRRLRRGDRAGLFAGSPSTLQMNVGCCWTSSSSYRSPGTGVGIVPRRAAVRSGATAQGAVVDDHGDPVRPADVAPSANDGTPSLVVAASHDRDDQDDATSSSAAVQPVDEQAELSLRPRPLRTATAWAVERSHWPAVFVGDAVRSPAM